MLSSTRLANVCNTAGGANRGTIDYNLHKIIHCNGYVAGAWSTRHHKLFTEVILSKI